MGVVGCDRFQEKLDAFGANFRRWININLPRIGRPFADLEDLTADHGPGEVVGDGIPDALFILGHRHRWVPAPANLRLEVVFPVGPEEVCFGARERVHNYWDLLLHSTEHLPRAP